jgi:hypothetical protein
MKLRWEKQEEDWYWLYGEMNVVATVSKDEVDGILRWCAYMDEDMPPGDATFKTLKAAKAYCEKRVKRASKSKSLHKVKARVKVTNRGTFVEVESGTDHLTLCEEDAKALAAMLVFHTGMGEQELEAMLAALDKTERA